MYRTIVEQTNKSTTKYIIVILLQQKVSLNIPTSSLLELTRILMKHLVSLSQLEITELPVAGDTLEMELPDVVLESHHVAELNVANGAVRDQADGPALTF